MSQLRTPGLVTCTWDDGLLPVPSGMTSKNTDASRSADWLVVNATRTSSTSARISVKGVNTRSCRLYFDSNPVTSYTVQGSSGHLTGGNEFPKGGVSLLQLWSRTWDREFNVDVQWTSDSTQQGRVACEWVEYESGTAGTGISEGTIPAFEEVLRFLPKWAVVSKTTDGLVEALGAFSV